ncbi:MAG: hypothetical protein RSA84_17425 [Acinetobacter sp.]
MANERTTPKQITNQLKSWWQAFWFWNITHYSLGLSASICSVLISKKNSEICEFLPTFVAVATAAITFMKSGAKGNAYISAWRKLNAARIKFELDPSYTETMLAEVHADCEKIIGKAD